MQHKNMDLVLFLRRIIVEAISPSSEFHPFSPPFFGNLSTKKSIFGNLLSFMSHFVMNWEKMSDLRQVEKERLHFGQRPVSVCQWFLTDQIPELRNLESGHLELMSKQRVRASKWSFKIEIGVNFPNRPEFARKENSKAYSRKFSNVQTFWNYQLFFERIFNWGSKSEFRKIRKILQKSIQSNLKKT